MVQTIIEIISNPHIDNVKDCVENKRIPRKEIMNDILCSAFETVDVNYTVESLQIEESENRYTMGVSNGEGSCVVYDESNTELNYFDYEISYGLLNDEPVCDKLEIIIHLE